MRRVKIIPHPDGTRRILILRRDDGRHTFQEQERLGNADDRFGWMHAEAAADDGDPWIRRNIGGPGPYGTAEDAETDALKWLEGYRVLH
jgi:hypothetical protein